MSEEKQSVDAGDRLQEVRKLADSGIADEDIKSTKFLYACFDQLLTGFWLRDISWGG